MRELVVKYLSKGVSRRGFVTGLILGLVLLHLVQSRAQHEIIVDFTVGPALTAGPPPDDERGTGGRGRLSRRPAG